MNLMRDRESTQVLITITNFATQFKKIEAKYSLLSVPSEPHESSDSCKGVMRQPDIKIKGKRQVAIQLEDTE